MFARELIDAATEIVAPAAKRLALEWLAPAAVIAAAAGIVYKAVEYCTQSKQQKHHQSNIHRIQQQQAKATVSSSSHAVMTQGLPPVKQKTANASASQNNKPISYKPVSDLQPLCAVSIATESSNKQRRRQREIDAINADLAKSQKKLEIQAAAQQLKSKR